jgi:putative aminophosphonate oxidoreductase
MAVEVMRSSPALADGKHRSLWLREALAGADVEPPLVDAVRADVAIVGGGYVGLWTAIRIKEREPACDVAIVEQDVCGGGASGRNGGFAISWWCKAPSLVKRFGQEEGLRLALASEAAVDELGGFCAEHGIDAHFRKAGWLWTATTRAQLDGWEDVVRMAERLGADVYERLSPDEVARRAGSSAHLAGVLDKTGGIIHPGFLVRGLARVARELGVRIYERSRVVELDRDYPPTLRTEHGALTAEKIVLATNAWAAGVPELRRGLVIVSSDIVATAPIPDRLREIGWTGGEAITDSQLMVDYYRTTRDGRIVFGKGGWGIAFGGRIGPDFDRSRRRAAAVSADFRRTYPNLASARLSDDWSGPIDRSATGLPLLGRLGGRDHILYGVGWSGNGVAPSLLGGKILASLALGLDDEWSQSSLVDQRFARLPPEPIRFIGAHIVREAVRRKEAAEAEGRTPNQLSVLLAKLVPAGLEDRAHVHD